MHTLTSPSSPITEAATSPNRLVSWTARTRLHQALAARPTRLHTTAVLAAFIALAAVNTVLEALYVRSGFPVSYAEGQTTFDGARIKGFYAVLIDQGSMGTYWATQLFDYVFMAAVALFGATAGSRLMRAARHRSMPRVEAVAAAGAVGLMLGASFDAVENLVSFVMLAQPRSFADWLAVPYSSAAVLKFTAITLGGLGLLAAAVVTSFAAISSGVRRAS